jgi:dCMP deaminase
MNHIVGTGYNGFVGGSDESYFSWESNGEWLETKHAYVVHAEVNAILNSTTHALAGCHLYTTLFPCNECAKVISQKKIIEVIYLSAKNFDHETRIAARSIFEASRITTRQISMPPLEEFADWVISRMVL